MKMYVIVEVDFHEIFAFGLEGRSGQCNSHYFSPGEGDFDTVRIES